MYFSIKLIIINVTIYRFMKNVQYIAIIYIFSNILILIKILFNYKITNISTFLVKILLTTF